MDFSKSVGILANPLPSSEGDISHDHVATVAKQPLHFRFFYTFYSVMNMRTLIYILTYVVEQF